MYDFLSILDEHRELLTERGYQSLDLGSFEIPGIFMKELEKQFTDCIKTIKPNNGKKDFYINTAGFFDDEKEMVVFTFHYQYNPQKKYIELKQLDAQWNKIEKQYLLESNMYQLPHADKVRQELKKLSEAQMIANHEITTKDIKISKTNL